jgi:hypothetical protein
MSSLPASPDAPPVGRSTWDLGLKGNGVRLDAFLKSLENVDVVDNASEVRLRRVCEAVDADVSPNGRNLVFYLSAHETRSVDFLRRVLSLGLRPDVPDSTGELPVDAALSYKKFTEAKTLPLDAALSRKQFEKAQTLVFCRPELRHNAHLCMVSSEHELWVKGEAICDHLWIHLGVNRND